MDNGKKTIIMGTERRPLQVVLVMKVNTVTERFTDMECVSGPMVISTMETGTKEFITVMVSRNGQTVKNITDNGSLA